MKIQTTWNLGLMYKSHKDPQIEKDVTNIELACDSFLNKWGTDSSFIKNNSKLIESLLDYKNLQHVIGDVKPLSYYMLARDMDSRDTFVTAQLSKLQSRVTYATNQVLFFELELGRISKTQQDKILKDKKFNEFKYFLEKVWKVAQYKLGEKEEKILALKYEPANCLWTNATEKLISEQVVLWKGKTIPIHEAVGMISSLPLDGRKKMHDLVIEKLKSIGFFAEAELNAVIINKKIDDELRGLKHPYSATILDYENDESVISNLMQLLKKSYSIAHTVSEIKASLMNRETLYYYDMGVTLSAGKQVFTFEKSVEIIRTAFGKVDSLYVEIFDRFLENGQIDVYPRLGKKGGGYCWGAYNRPTYVLLNWTDDLNSLRTLAHEMGHAIHRELSKQQTVMYENHPISTAEVASTLFENFAFAEVLQHLPLREQAYAQFNHLQDACSTIFRQAAYFGYEEDIHAMIRERGQISQVDFAVTMQKHLQAQLGKKFKITQDDGYLFVRYMHARWFFYVYSYAYGQLISSAMYGYLKQDSKFVEKINKFLSAGGSMSPEDIFKSIGIDTGKSDFWKAGLDVVKADIKNLKKMIAADQK